MKQLNLMFYKDPLNPLVFFLSFG